MPAKTHGMSRRAKGLQTLSYKRWIGMKDRCYNPNNAMYPHYGGRGLTVCPEWVNSFDCFHADMGDAPEGKSLDRIDNDKGYSKDNCKWSTPSEQTKNRRPYPHTRYVATKEVILRCKELSATPLSMRKTASLLGVSLKTVQNILSGLYES